MPYHCIVCVKQVPDTTNITGEAMKEDGTVNRAALPAIFNPDDLHALEAALSNRDAHGGKVTAVSMGPLGAAEALRECLYRGADRAIGTVGPIAEDLQRVVATPSGQRSCHGELL